MEPSGCCCSITILSPSALASVTSRNFLDPEIVASKSGKAKTLGLDNSSNISRTIRSWCGENSKLTPFRSRELSGCVRAAILGSCRLEYDRAPSNDLS